LQKPYKGQDIPLILKQVRTARYEPLPDTVEPEFRALVAKLLTS